MYFWRICVDECVNTGVCILAWQNVGSSFIALKCVECDYNVYVGAWVNNAFFDCVYLLKCLIWLDWIQMDMHSIGSIEMCITIYLRWNVYMYDYMDVLVLMKNMSCQFDINGFIKMKCAFCAHVHVSAFIYVWVCAWVFVWI